MKCSRRDFGLLLPSLVAAQAVPASNVNNDVEHLAAEVAALVDDLAGLQTYLRHPAHEELGRLFGQSLSGSLVYDFEVGGTELLGASGWSG